MKHLSLYSLLILTLMGNSQQDLTLYYLENVPQRQYLNPSFRPNSKVNIGLPVISSIYLDHLNTTFTPANLFETNNDVTSLTLDKLKDNIQDNNYLGLSTKIDLFSLGIQLKKNFFSFNISENIVGRINLSKGFLELPLYGNADFNHHGGNIDMSNTGLNLSHYREYGFGWQRKVSDKLDVGARVKYLTGLSNIWVKKNSFQLKTNPDNYDWTISGELDFRSSGFDSTGNLRQGNAQEYLMNSENNGVAIDIGLSYKISEKISVNASVVDLGFINWASEINSIGTNDATITVTGVDLTEIIYAADSAAGDSLNAAFDRLREAAEDDLGYSENKDSYRKMLLTRLHVGGTYSLFKSSKLGGKAGVLLQAEIYNTEIRPSLTLSYNQKVGSWLNASVSYSMVNRGFNNLGLGFSANLGAVQLFAAMDNVFASRMTQFQTGDASQQVNLFSYPANSKKTHIHFGLNLTFGAKKIDKKEEAN